MVVMSRRESSNSHFRWSSLKALREIISHRLKSDNDRGVEGAKLPN